MICNQPFRRLALSVNAKPYPKNSSQPQEPRPQEASDWGFENENPKKELYPAPKMILRLSLYNFSFLHNFGSI